MGGRHALVAGQPRALGRHDGADGRAFREAWRALVVEFGQPAPHTLLRLEMSRVATLYATDVASQRRLADARRARAEGKGRKPSRVEIGRLEKRAALNDEAYARALDRLREMAQRQRSTAPASAAELLAMARQTNG